MKIQIRSLNLKNFLSHKDTRLGPEYFDRKNYLIAGENKDDEGMLSNGAGKSNIAEAILFATTGTTFKGLKGDDVIMKGEKTCSVRLNMLLDGKKKAYVIYQRKPNKLVFFNGEKKVHASDMNELFKKIQKFIGYDFKSLTKFVMIGENDRNRFSFLESNDSEKKEVLSMLIDVNDIDKAYESVKNGLELYEKQEIEMSSKISVHEEVIERHRGKLHRLRQELKAFKKEKSSDAGIEDLRKKISILKEDKKEAERLICKYSDKNLKLEKAQDAEVRKNGGYIESFSKHIGHCEGVIKSLEVELAGIITCPHCSKDINNTGKTKNKIKEEIRDYQKINEDSRKSIEEYRKKNRLLEKKFQEDYDKSSKKINHYENKRQEIMKVMQELQRTLDSLTLKKSEEKKNILKGIESVKAEIAECEQNLSEIQDSMDKNKKRIEVYKKMKFHFGKEGFKNYLFSRKIKIVEQEVNDILMKTKTKMKVTLSGMTKLKSGKFNQKINAAIEIDGIENKWEELSKGQKRRVDLAFILAFSRLTNSRNQFLFRSFDEPFGGLDKEGEDNVLQMLEKLNHTVWILSPQERIKERFKSGDVITVVKENGISYIKQ